MNNLQAQKIAFQVADSALILGAILGQFAIRRSERLWAICQDQARIDWELAQPALLHFAHNAAREIEFLVDDAQCELYERGAVLLQTLMILPSLFCLLQNLDHEIPLYLESELKPMGRVVQALPAPAIAGLLPAAPVVALEIELPAQPFESHAVEVSAEGATSVLVIGCPAVAPAEIESSVVQQPELPANWDRDRNGRKLTGTALQMRMKRYSLA